MILLMDCSAGASGDMLLAAMLDLGLPVEAVRRCLRGLGLARTRIRVERIPVGGVRACRIRVSSPEGAALPRQASDLIRRISGSALPPALRRPVAGVIARLAAAEAAAHSTPMSRVRFHQLAGADMLAAVAGFCAGLRHFGICAVYATPVPVGTWHIGHQGRWIHRPGPATLRLLRRFPARRAEGRFEWTTPTAAALLASFGSGAPHPPLRVERIGHAAGHRPPPGGPGFLTALAGYPLD